MNGQAIVSTVVDGNTSVVGARKVGAGDINGDGRMDLVVVRSNGLDVRLYYNAGASTFVAGPQITVTTEVRDAWIVKWGTNLAPRVVLHGAAGIGVYHADLTSDSVLRTTPPGPAIDAAGVFTLPSGEQGIGWVTQLSAGSSSQKFMTYRQSGSTNWGQVGPVGGEVPYEPGVSSLVFGDATSDGYPDLVLGATGGPDLLYVRNLARASGGPLVFDVSGAALWPKTVSSSTSSNTAFRATPVLADFNGDRLTDLYVAVQNAPGQTTLPGPLDVQSPSFLGSPPVWPITAALSAVTDPVPPNFPPVDQLRLQLADAWTNHGNATHLRAIVWRWRFPCNEDNPSGCTQPDMPLDTTALHNRYFPLLPGGSLPANASITLPLEPFGTHPWAAYFVELSLVQATITGSTARVTNAWQTFSYGFAREPIAGGTDPHAHGPITRMRALPDADLATEMDVQFPSGVSSLLAAPTLGIVIKIPRQPPFPPNTVPVLGAPQPGLFD
jgi:hypothetical protein